MMARHPHSLSHRIARTALAFGLLALIAGCAGRQEGPDEKEAKLYMKGLEGHKGVLRPGIDANALYASAMGLKAKGDCKDAVAKLRDVAAIGPGYEDAQTALGECLITEAGSETLSADYLEGLTWLRRAGDAGWPEAQGQLANAHAFGPAAIRNPEEAAYWLALYDGNPDKARVGFVPLPADQLAAIRAAIPPAALTIGTKRAAGWTSKEWTSPTPAPTPGPTETRARDRGAFGDDGPRDRD